ncbi:MAG TPA: endolytic transglycosylase MltG [Candidatus Binatia bacterium]|nr:endolytic transglycosylase MltG [Candidatus Binatia bacterium]
MKKVLIILSVLAGSLAALAWTGAWLSTPVTKDAGSFVVAQGEGTAAIVSRLKAQGVIRSELLFKMALAGSGLDKKLQPGTYDLRGAEDFAEIVRRLATGGIPANEFVLLVKEGWNLNDIKAALVQAGYAEADKLFFVTGIPATDHRELSSDKAPRPQDYSTEFPFLEGKPSYVSLEGYLFPDTYRVFKAATPMELVKVLLANFGRKLTPELRQRIAEKHRTIFDVVTMASIVEREVKTDEDRRLVADIFWRRIEKGMPLQADSTVNYATGKSQPSVSFEDTKTVSRYNTYKYPGLPLGPICNPGLASLKAAIDPEPNDYWYFLTDAEGKVHYAATLDEHNRNKARYLK